MGSVQRQCCLLELSGSEALTAARFAPTRPYLQEGGLLKLLTLGDCGIALLREGEGIVFRAEVRMSSVVQRFLGGRVCWQDCCGVGCVPTACLTLCLDSFTPLPPMNAAALWSHFVNQMPCAPTCLKMKM